jgi:hypothetical protein
MIVPKRVDETRIGERHKLPIAISIAGHAGTARVGGAGLTQAVDERDDDFVRRARSEAYHRRAPFALIQREARDP